MDHWNGLLEHWNRLLAVSHEMLVRGAGAGEGGAWTGQDSGTWFCNYSV